MKIKLEDLKPGIHIKYDDGGTIEIMVISNVDENQVMIRLVYANYGKYTTEEFSLSIDFVCKDRRMKLSSAEEIHYYKKLEVFQ